MAGLPRHIAERELMVARRKLGWSDDRLSVEEVGSVRGPGNVITLEPGVYVPGVGGVRIEDDFVVTSDGVENLTPFPREVVSVG